MVPIAAFGLFCEDVVRSGRMWFFFESMETAEILMNVINVDVKVYFVLILVFECFNGLMDVLNFFYEGKLLFEGEDVILFIEMVVFGVYGMNVVYKYFGLYGRSV